MINMQQDESDISCVDPESFVRWRPTLTGFFRVLLVDEGREDPSISGPSLARQQKAISMTFHWRADCGPTCMIAC